MKRTFLITTAVVLALLGTLACVSDPARWPAPEDPPHQGEAVDIAAMRTRATHAPTALARLVREPQNAWSNLAFVVGGAFLFSTAARRVARGIGGVLIGVGLGSFLYHASASRTLRHLDVAAMYWLFLVSGVLSISAVFPSWRARIEARAIALFLVTFAGALCLTAARNISILGTRPLALRVVTAVAAAVMIVALIVIAWRGKKLATMGQLIGIVVLFGAAVTCQTGDRPGGWLFNPASAIQAHAVWHILSAVAFVLSVRILDTHTILAEDNKENEGML